MEKDPNDSNKNLGIKIQDCYSIKDGENSGELDEEKASAQTGLDLSVPKAPPDEFAKIMAEMERRNITPRIHWELKVRNLFLSAARGMRRPVVAAALAVALIFTTAAGVSARKGFTFRMNERGHVTNNIVWNNNASVLAEEDSIDEAYRTIESQLGIKPLKMYSVPEKMKFEKLRINNGKAIMQFTYNNKLFTFSQTNSVINVSENVISDRQIYSEIENKLLSITIRTEKNQLPDDSIEYSASFGVRDTYYYLSGIMDEDTFRDIVANLAY